MVALRKSAALLLVLVAVAACSKEPPRTQERKAAVPEKSGVMFDGVAWNAKAGAIVDVAGATYYLKGVEAWPKELVGKRVRVRGSQLEQETYPEPRGPNGEIAAGLAGTVTRILDPKWEALP